MCSPDISGHLIRIPWSAVPVMRIEALLLQNGFMFHINKVSYWSRTVMIPLFILAALKPVAVNPRRVDISELFVTPADKEINYMANPTGNWLGTAFLTIDRLFRPLGSIIPTWVTKLAIEKALVFMKERLNGEEGLGAIFPAMANTVMAYHRIGVSRDEHPDYQMARKSIDKLLVFHKDWGYCQPCLSPCVGYGLAGHAVMGEIG